MKEPVPEDLAKLAEKASPRGEQKAESARETNRVLASGLDRLRGEAVQKAKAVNVRLRWGLAGAALASFGVGVLMGMSVSKARGCSRASALLL